MKRLPLILFLACSTVVLAVEEPPAELLENLDFFKSMDLMEHDEVMAPLTSASFNVKPSSPSATLEEPR